MKIFYSIEDFLQSRLHVKSFIPTMGNLHEGHLSLVRKAKDLSSNTCVSIYVNKAQFDKEDDFKSYPKTLEDDIKKLQNLNVDYLLIPEEPEIEKFSKPLIIKNEPTHLTKDLCGKYRKGHFLAVMDIVHRFFQIVRPENVFFGMKDYQQLMVIKELIKSQNYEVNLIESETIRSNEGLALSSRNKNLSEEQLQHASEIYKSLKYAKHLIKQDCEIDEINTKIYQYFEEFPIEVEYFSIRDLKTLQQLYDSDLIALIAVYIGKVRLIDNIIIESTP
jgi:pantoate--beta-alanine ligase|tara:strand:+ start:1357 stop:2184 length:828 start_codon:yes stop_codon:yes gene_type:complete